MGKRGIITISLGALFVLGFPAITSFLATEDPEDPKDEREEIESPEKPLSTPRVEILPAKVIQGSPVLVRVTGAHEPLTISLNKKPLQTFIYKDASVAFIGIDLNATPGTSTLTVSYASGTSTESKLVVEARKKITAPLGIPQKLGGNTTASVQKLVSTLAQENEVLLNLASVDKTLWSEDFAYPLADPVVTDDYGYTRSTVGQSISHKGTDFRAASGTPVFAMNDGEVRLATEFRNYGNTIVIDHGLGLMTFYMHLSKIEVREGELVTRGTEIGLSGQSGYAEVPHLHLTMRINHISIDPIVFLNLF